MKIVVLDGYTENPGDLSWEGFEQLGELTVYDRTPEDKIVERIGNAEAVIVNKAPITRQTLELQRGGYGSCAEKENTGMQYSYLWNRCCCAVHHCVIAGDLPPCRAPQRGCA